MSRLAASLCLLSLCFALAVSLLQEDVKAKEGTYWKDFKAKFGKQYFTRSADQYRQTVFLNNLLAIIHHNVEADLGLKSYRLEINAFADLTKEEFVRKMTGFAGAKKSKPGLKLGAAPATGASNDTALPAEVDWRTKGIVSPIRDQKKCGSCWAFAAVSALESHQAKATGKLVALSEQNLVDCSTPFGNMGCSGGLMDYAYEYVKANGGLQKRDTYPYEAEEGDCRYNASQVGVTCSGYVDVKPDELSLQKAVAEVGLVTVGIDASSLFFQLYSEGIYDDPTCDPDGLNHAITVVGYGSEDGTDYWIIRNSWGVAWGDKGYAKIVRNKNMCGIASVPSYPTI